MTINTNNSNPPYNIRYNIYDMSNRTITDINDTNQYVFQFSILNSVVGFEPAFLGFGGIGDVTLIFAKIDDTYMQLTILFDTNTNILYYRIRITDIITIVANSTNILFGLNGKIFVNYNATQLINTNNY